MVIFKGDVWSSFVDKQYFYILLFQTARKAVLVLVAPAVLFLKISKQEYWLYVCFFHCSPKMTFGKGFMAFAFYFKFADEIGTEQYALILFFCSGLPRGPSDKS